MRLDLACFLTILILLMIRPPDAYGGASASDSTTAAGRMSKFRSPDDNWIDLSAFLQQQYGFLPVPIIVTEPAVGYGGGVGLMFMSKPLPARGDGLGRPNISMVGGFGTENGTWGTAAGDLRHWRDDRVQTMGGIVYASANLDFYGIGDDVLLADHPLGYNLEPKGGTARVKYRFGDSRIWAGLNYAFVAVDVTFDQPSATAGLPDFSRETSVGGVTPSVTLDTRNNFFTPVRGRYLELAGGFFGSAFGGDADFQRAQLVIMQYVPVSSVLFLGVRADVAASFGDAPFFLRPFITLRGTPALRYQGEDTAQIETELRWQCWKRFSLVGFGGVGAAWNGFDDFDDRKTVGAGGTGFRYELAREYGLHAGLDFAFSPDDFALYIQIGSAWARP